MKKLRILNSKGDEVLEWDVDEKEAKIRFKELKSQGYAFHAIKPEAGILGEANRLVNKFKEIGDDEEVIAIPHRVGG